MVCVTGTRMLYDVPVVPLTPVSPSGRMARPGIVLLWGCPAETRPEASPAQGRIVTLLTE